MSTQQQIQAWNAAVVQKQQEKADQETILKVEQEQLARAEQARINAELAAARAASRGASPEQVAELQRQARLADSAESDARIAAGKTQRNIESLDGSIRYNTSQRDQFQAALPAQGTAASTVADRPANARTNAAEIAPAPTPAPDAAAPVPPSQRGDNGGFVTNAQGELVPSDSAEAEEIRAEQNRIEALEAAPQREFVTDPNTGEFIPSDSAQAEEIRAGQNRVETDAPDPVDDPFEAARLAAEEGGEGPTLEAPESVSPNLTSSWNSENGNFDVIDIDSGETVASGLTAEEAARTAGDPFEAARLAREAEFDEEQPAVFGPEPVAGSADLGLQDPAQRAQQAVQQAPLTPEQQEAKEQAAAKANAINQATRQSVYKQGGSTDWRVRLQLSPTSNYLYNVPPPPPGEAGGPGILAPLFNTNGVIFPYTPNIQTTYRANYTNYDLVHSNFRGVFYQNSRVDDINLKATFTAQDTNEADYLLAVIHFFRSVTKMFYGKDAQRGTPPPLVYLSGLGMNQFYGHPCLVSAFTYSLPDNVDYIRASTVNNYGTDLLSRRTASAPSSMAGLGATGNRLLNAGLARFGESKPAQNSVVASVNNMQLANYVPTKMEIDLILIPVQTRSQVSKQFSLKGFADGNLIKGGFW